MRKEAGALAPPRRRSRPKSPSFFPCPGAPHSAFYESDRCTSTGLLKLIRTHRESRNLHAVGRMFVVGLGFETCVRFTAEDSVLLVADQQQQHKLGWDRVFVIEEACGFLAKESKQKAKTALEALDVTASSPAHSSSSCFLC